MKIANVLTLSRVFCSPVYVSFFFLSAASGRGERLFSALALVVAVGIEITDVLDGYLARRLNQTSDWGKIADPLADVISRLTYFLCFVVAGFIDYWVIFVLFFRELGMILVRLTLVQRGKALGAGMLGKIKTTAYGAVGILGSVLLLLSVRGVSVNVFEGLSLALRLASYVSVALAVVSMALYLPHLWRDKG